MEPSNENISESDGQLTVKCTRTVRGKHTCFVSLYDILEVQL